MASFGQFGGDPMTLEGFIIDGTIGGITNILQGQNFGNGFLVAGVGAWAGVGLAPVLGRGMNPYLARVLASAIVGGTMSELTGGKFADE